MIEIMNYDDTMALYNISLYKNRIATVRFGSVSIRSVPVRSGSGSFRFRFNSGSDSLFFNRKIDFGLKKKNRFFIKFRFFDIEKSILDG